MNSLIMSNYIQLLSDKFLAFKNILSNLIFLRDSVIIAKNVNRTDIETKQLDSELS